MQGIYLKKIDFDFMCFNQTLPFTVYDAAGKVIGKADQKLTPKISKKLVCCDLYCDEKDFIQYIFKNIPSEHFNSDYISNLINDIALTFTTNLINLIHNYEEIEVENCYQIRNDLIEKIKNKLRDSITPEQFCIIDEFEKSHPINVLNLSIMLSMKLNYEKDRLFDIGLAALLHDVGFSYVPAYISKKPHKKLNKNERKMYEMHPIFSLKSLVKELGVKKHIAEIILHHHEFLDGSGFPQELKGDEINYNSFIINIASTYDRMIYNKYDGIERNPREIIHKLQTDFKDKYPPVILNNFVALFNYELSDLLDNNIDEILSA